MHMYTYVYCIVHNSGGKNFSKPFKKFSESVPRSLSFFTNLVKTQTSVARILCYTVYAHKQCCGGDMDCISFTEFRPKLRHVSDKDIQVRINMLVKCSLYTCSVK